MQRLQDTPPLARRGGSFNREFVNAVDAISAALMWFFCRFEKASFPQENEKNNRATMISVKLISVALNLR
jgi:hypothetical protein